MTGVLAATSTAFEPFVTSNGANYQSLYEKYNHPFTTRLIWTVLSFSPACIYSKSNMSWTPHKTCILNSNVITVWFWLRSSSPQVHHQDYFAMSVVNDNRSLCIIMAMIVWSFIAMLGVFKNYFICVSTWNSNHLSIRRDTVSDGLLQWAAMKQMLDLHYLWFTPVLPPDVCCWFTWTLLSVTDSIIYSFFSPF